jgi:hypothetical protein
MYVTVNTRQICHAFIQVAWFVQVLIRVSRCKLTFIMLHVGGINDFVHNAKSVYKAWSATGDYHGQMNSADSEKWVIEKLVSSLPPHAIIVLNNAPYHCIQTNKQTNLSLRTQKRNDSTVTQQRYRLQCDHAQGQPLETHCSVKAQREGFQDCQHLVRLWAYSCSAASLYVRPKPNRTGMGQNKEDVVKEHMW